jgi:hypothetical protein
VQHREVNGPLDVKLEPAAFEQSAQAFRDAAFLPKPAKGQIGSQPEHRHRLQFTGGMGVEHREGLAVAQAGAHEPFQLTAGLQQVEPAQGGNDLLTHLFAVPNAVRDLQITVGTGGFDAEKHGRMAWVYRQQP